MRPEDINIHCCIGQAEIPVTVDFYMFERSELNTFDKSSLADILKYHNQSPIAVEKVILRSLKSILDEYLPSGTEIDLLSVDAEGVDEMVLLSNDWNRYRPKVIIVENHSTIYNFLNTTMHEMLVNNNYTLGGYNRHSYVFHDLAYNKF
jgi:hypothetical protein